MALGPSNNQSVAVQSANRERAQQDVFRREVDEAVRQDTISTFFRRFGKLLIAGFVIVAAALGAWAWWHHEVTTSAEEDAVELTMAIDQLQAGNTAAASERAAPLLSDAPAGYSVPAAFIAAAAALEEGDSAKAAKLFDEIAADAGNPQPMRDLATIRSVSAQYDTMEPQAVIDRLKPLAVPGNAFFPSAGEMVAMAYVEQGKKDLAGPMFAEIARDEDAPQSLRARARQLAGMMGTDAVDDAEEVADLVASGGAAGQ
ncbi:tetratricopeptide repeat protein [Croceicoccus mobilis]|uniref:Membrane protein n=1 Tax=Croceicoccus mobilis TaxID=1703339 RepID=A0A916Z0J2_9SPHN|nr:tetratricopeptide repeat protein [Croceicoccus mobilis]GGD68687.1 membrane protein [Croceicoccus mobilis]